MLSQERSVSAQNYSVSPFLLSSVLSRSIQLYCTYKYNNRPAQCELCLVSSPNQSPLGLLWAKPKTIRRPACPIWLPSDPALELWVGTWVWRGTPDPFWNVLWIYVESARSIWIGENVNRKASNCFFWPSRKWCQAIGERWIGTWLVPCKFG